MTEPMLRELFSQMIQACEGWDPAPGPPVLNAQIRTGGNATSTFAFVEFRDEKISATVSTFNGMELSGRHLKISHPNGYVEPAVPVEPLGVPDALAQKFGLDSYGAMRRRDTPQEAFNDRKARELYVGNLTMGAVSSQMLIDLFTAPLGALPGIEGEGPVVAEAKVRGGRGGRGGSHGSRRRPPRRQATGTDPRGGGRRHRLPSRTAIPRSRAHRVHPRLTALRVVRPSRCARRSTTLASSPSCSSATTSSPRSPSPSSTRWSSAAARCSATGRRATRPR